ncbi:MAG: hypothetical protein Q7N50_08535 [Armatimonadota bacterium]|nr:hypothetical protein [Armatimonadota bacterium]
MIEYVSLNEDNLEAVHALSNRNLEFDNVSFDIFRFKTLQDPNFDPAMAIVAMSGGRPCGYMMGVCRDNGDSISAAVKLRYAAGMVFLNRLMYLVVCNSRSFCWSLAAGTALCLIQGFI